MKAAVSDSALLGSVLGDKYRILREIGRGGMGIVYEAEYIALNKRVAIKLMLEKYLEDPEATKRFHREAQAAGKIGNAHIIDITDIGYTFDGRAFVVMELLQGVPLSAVIKAGPLPPWRALAIMKQVLRGVGAAHSKGIIHRDLKPDNIFLVDQGQPDFVKLLDFGISKIVEPDEAYAATRLTTTGVVMGTPLYMAPEQAMGQPISHLADLYACGVILYEMLAGVPPFDGPTYAVLVSKLLTMDPPPLSQMRPGLPPGLVAAVHRVLEKEPERRFVSADQFAAAIGAGSSGIERAVSAIELAGTVDSNMGISGASAVAAAAGQYASYPAYHSGQPPRAAKPKWPLFAAAGAVVVVATAVIAAVVFTGGNGTSAKATGSPSDKPVPERKDTAPSVQDLAKESVAKNPPPTPPPPAPATGTLEVKTTQPGAHILIDSKDVGTSPIIASLPPGPHHIRAELAGYQAIETDEEVRANERTAMVLPLVKGESKKSGSSRPPSIVRTTTPLPKPAGGSAAKGSGIATPDFDPSNPSKNPATTGPSVGPQKDPPQKDPPDQATVPKPESGSGKPNPYRKPNPY